jgi:parallel beta-helix repeat protein
MNHQKIFGTLGKAVVVLFIASLFVLPGSATIVNEQDKNVQRMNNGGTTIYVDDDNTAGPWDGTLEHPYQFIQDGIDHAADDDTVFVFSGIYNENIVIFPSLTLLGENKERTIIDGDGVGTVVKITADSVSLSGFTITKCGSDPNDAGILIHTRYNTIYENNIRKNNYYGIHVLADDNTFYHNNIVENTYQAFDEVAGSAWDSGYP